MKKMPVDRKKIGRAERIDFPSLGLLKVPAKIDTGADVSSIWATNIRKTPEGLRFVLFDKSSAHYTGQEILVTPSAFTITRISNSFGVKELRFKVKLTIRVKNKRIRGTFTLSDRSKKTYPILLGRRLLSGKFIVDVTRGKPLRKTERYKKKILKKELKRLEQV
ncbi:MAG: RimK/LysX family protein [Candidatus Saccharimonadales bacterium]